MLLKFAVKDFMEDRELKNISPYTTDRYIRVLDEFQKFIFKENLLNVDDISSNLIKKYILYCQNEKQNNATTRNTKLRVLKSFFNYLVESNYIFDERNPCKKVSYAIEDIRIEVFQDYHINQMLSYYRKLKDRTKSYYAYRDHTMILFLLSSGLRCGELSNLKWRDVDLINQTATVFGKKREQSSIPLVYKIVRELSEFKMFCETQFKEHPEYVFPTQKNTQMTPNAIKCVFKRLQRDLGFKDVRLSSHTFRHTMAHRMIMNGADVFTLQRMLRHTDLEMSKKYLALWGTALKEQNDKYNPLNHIQL